MPRTRRTPAPSDWRAIASLGERLISANSLTGQRDRIVNLASRMVRGTVDVWLHENLFRLPNWKQPRAFPPEPRSEIMRRALARRKAVVQSAAERRGVKKCVAAIPIADQGLVLGVLQVTRPGGPNFSAHELELLESIAGVVAVGLFAAHRVELERFRLGELNLVSRVSAEIANVLHLDELSRRVCELIRETFNYYYVAIFTLKPGDTRLRFRASASGQRRGKRSNPLPLDVKLGQGLIGQAAKTGETIAAPDVKADRRYRFLPPLPETRSEVAIPLKLDNRVLGVLDLQSSRLNAFHPNDMMLLQALADNIARAVEGARLYSDLRRRADQLTLLAEVSRGVTSLLDLDAMMGEAAALIHDRFGFQHVSLFTVHPNRRQIEYEAGSGKRSEALHGYSISLDDKQGIIPWVARHGKTVLANDVGIDPRYRPSPLPPRNTKAELTVPLLFGDQVLGVLDIQSDKLQAFTEDDRLMFEAAGGVIAAAIRNADLFRSEQWRRQVADSLREVAGLLSENVSVDQALQAILTELDRNLPVDVSVIWLLREGELRVGAVRGGRAEAIERARLASADAGEAVQRLMLSPEPAIRKPSDPMWPTGRAAGFPRDYSSLAAPLRVGDQSVGLLALAHHERGRYGHEARAMAETFASYAAVAIENARLYDSAQEQAYASAALLQVAQTVASPLEIDEILDSVVRMLPILLGVRRAALFGWNPSRDSYTLRAQFGINSDPGQIRLANQIPAGGFRLLDTARKTGQPVFRILKPQDAPARWRRLGPSTGASDPLHASASLLMAVPLLMRNDPLGVLLIEEGDGASRFRARRFEIIQGISQEVAIAMQNDLLQGEMMLRERLETEAQLARQIQAAFIPQTLPHRPGWELAARWETARQVGGDFYDAVELAGGKLGLLIADVADKGMPAALFMALTRTLFRAAATETQSAAEVIRRVNTLLVPDTGQGMFVTAVYAVLDPDRATLTYANAGHTPPLLIRNGGAIERLTRTSIALGVIDNCAVEERGIELAVGDTVLLYTDGVTEAFSPDGEFFGETHLREAVLRSGPASAEELLEAVQGDLNAFIAPLALPDDLTMMAIRRSHR